MTAIGALIVGLVWTSSTVHHQAGVIGHLESTQACLNTVVESNRAQHLADQQEIAYLGQEVAALTEQVRALGGEPVQVRQPSSTTGSASGGATPAAPAPARQPTTTTTRRPVTTPTTRSLIPPITLPTLLSAAQSPTGSAC